MRALFLIPGGAARQLQCLPAVAAVADQLSARVQVVCAASVATCWGLLPSVEKVIPFDFDAATLADWANLLGSVREPDFQLCINLASGRQVDLMLSMSHIPTRIAAAGFSATETVTPAAGWPDQCLEAYLRPVGVSLDAAAFRLTLPRPDLDKAAAQLPAGDGPLLLLSPSGDVSDWPGSCWQELPGLIGARLPGLRSLTLAPLAGGDTRLRAALLAAGDVVLASDGPSIELALLLGLPLVALGRSSDSMPSRQGVQGLAGDAGGLVSLEPGQVLVALGLA